MQTFLMVVGGIVVGVAVVVVLAALVFKLWLRWKLGRIGYRMHQLDGSAAQAVVPRIHLAVLNGTLGPRPMKLVDAFRRMGYEDVGYYSVPNLMGITLWAGVHADGSAAVVYQHVALEPFFDLARCYEDATADSVTTNRTHNPKHAVPGTTIIHDVGLTPETARLLLLELPVRDGYRTLTAGDFVAAFEAIYARQMDYILLQDVTADDAERVRQQLDGPRGMSDDQLALAARIQREKNEAALIEVLLDHFRKAGGLSERDQDADILVIHEKMTAMDVIGKILFQSDPGQCRDIDIAALTAAHARVPLDLFDAINAHLPADAALRCLGEVTQPLRARFYISAN